jgi:hypothetical protein
MKLFSVRITQESLRGVDMREDAGDNRMVRQRLNWPVNGGELRKKRREKGRNGRNGRKSSVQSETGRFGFGDGYDGRRGRDVSLAGRSCQVPVLGGGRVRLVSAVDRRRSRGFSYY